MLGSVLAFPYSRKLPNLTVLYSLHTCTVGYCKALLNITLAMVSIVDCRAASVS